MIRIVLALAMMFALGRQACAETTAGPPRRGSRSWSPSVRRLVRIGDLVENAGAAADVAVFRAPDLGQTGAVPVVAHRRSAAAL